jgi:hypothetical protein
MKHSTLADPTPEPQLQMLPICICHLQAARVRALEAGCQADPKLTPAEVDALAASEQERRQKLAEAAARRAAEGRGREGAALRRLEKRRQGTQGRL